ncbi:type I restriction enzyme HsdR N-terminal domain-containing protein [Lacihabitans lacunae]|jgi:type I site-specific restriction endonuclease|uniref:Type I restriction enzyme HsdR N-terminal domain-containing protein n=1 Tax=Lacihabitans lacunae TaxID=1028214 RepID=A0ABV7YVP7_9BACT
MTNNLESRFKFKEIEGKQHIYDTLRNKYILLTPEEWVRQNMLWSLINELKYPKSLIKLEGGLNYNKLQKRTDIVVFDRTGKPFLLVECKAQEVPIDQKVVEQASRYNLIHKAPYICVTNGVKTFCFHIDFENNKTTQLKQLPDF